MAGGGQSTSVAVSQDVPDYRHGGPIALKYVKRGYHLLMSHGLTLCLVPLAATGLLELANMYQAGDLQAMWSVARQTNLTLNMAAFVACCLALALAAATYAFARSRPVYLLGYHCFKPPAHLKVSYDFFMEHSRAAGCFDAQSLEFQEKVLGRSGLGEETYLPEGLMARPPRIDMAAAREEANLVIFSCVEEVLRAHNVRPQAVDILIVNCSLFNPTPSLSAMIVNRFKMRSNVTTYNLGGMGCSAGVVAVGLAQQLLQVLPGATALVVSTENITQNWYFGNDRSMLIPNCLFRLGEGQTGVHLSRDLMKIAGHALKANITTLGPLVLPLSEQLLFFANLVARRLLRVKVAPYIPDFKLAFEHFCIHTGGRGVIDAIERQLELGPDLVGPSRESLYRYGNLSSPSIWYVLANIETKQGVRKGERVWQIAFGSGFKCNSAVWRALRNINDRHDAWLEDGGASAGKAVDA
eukprot:scaffold3.g6245.t1